LSDIAQVAALLVSNDPRGQAERTLSFLLSLNQGRAGAVFAVAGDRLSLFVGQNIDMDGIVAVQTAWSAQRQGLEQGTVVQQAGDRPYVIVPLKDEGGVVALLYMDSRDSHWPVLDTGSLSTFGVAIAKAVVAGGARTAVPSPLESYFSSATDDDFHRERLLFLLSKHDWNIARVARVMGVTRRTVYLRLERFNLSRKRMPKAARQPARPKLATT
jgi:regulatory Fis family protein